MRQYLAAGLLDELHVAVVPILLGSGERLLDGAPGTPGGLDLVELVSTSTVCHLRFGRR